MQIKKIILFSLCYFSIISSMDRNVTPVSKTNKQQQNDCRRVCRNVTSDCCECSVKPCCLFLAICVGTFLFHSCECQEGEDGAPMYPHANKYNPSRK